MAELISELYVMVIGLFFISLFIYNIYNSFNLYAL